MRRSRSIGACGVGLVVAAVSALAAAPLTAPESDGRSSLYRPAAERASILETLRDARTSIRATIEDLAALHTFDPAAPPDGSIVDALVGKAAQGIEVRVIIAPGGAPAELVATLTQGAVQVRESAAPFAASDAETFVVDDHAALILSGEVLPGAGHTRDFAIESTEPWLVARLARDFDASFADPNDSRGGALRDDDPLLDRDEPPELQDRFSPDALSRRQTT